MVFCILCRLGCLEILMRLMCSVFGWLCWVWLLMLVSVSSLGRWCIGCVWGCLCRRLWLMLCVSSLKLMVLLWFWCVCNVENLELGGVVLWNFFLLD